MQQSNHNIKKLDAVLNPLRNSAGLDDYHCRFKYGRCDSTPCLSQKNSLS